MTLIEKGTCFLETPISYTCVLLVAAVVLVCAADVQTLHPTFCFLQAQHTFQVWLMLYVHGHLSASIRHP